MTDKELIGYTREHSKTERALFHSDHIRRMYILAGKEDPAHLTGFYNWHYDQAHPIVELAEQRIK